MKKVKILPVIFAICLIFITASCNQLKEGVVVEKWYKPTTTTTVLIPISVGKMMVLIPYLVTDKEDWCIKIKGKFEGKDRRETVYVTQKRYNCVSLGDRFILDKDCSLVDQNNTQVEK